MSCNSCSNVTLPGVVGPSGAAGSDGADGAAGVFGGYSVEWEFETTTSSPPGTGFFRLNHATPASVTEIFIHQTAKGSIDATTFLASFTANNTVGSYGLIRLFKRHSSTVFWVGKVTGIVDSGSYYTLTVSHTLSNGTFSASDDIAVSFVSNGSNGTQGVPVLDLDTASYNHTTNTPTSVRGTNISANTIGTVGDFIKVKGDIIADKSDSFTPVVEIQFDGNRMFWYWLGRPVGYTGLRFEVDLIVTATNQITPHIKFEGIEDSVRTNKSMSGPIVFAANTVADIYQSSITLNSGTKRIDVILESDNSNTVSLTHYEVIKYLKE